MVEYLGVFYHVGFFSLAVARDVASKGIHLVKPVDPETLADVLERFESIVIDNGEAAGVTHD